MCGHGSRWVYGHNFGRWFDIVRHFDCTCPDPPHPDFVKEDLMRGTNDEEELKKFAPFWVQSIYNSLDELYAKYETLTGDITDTKEELKDQIEDEEKKEEETSLWTADELVDYIKEQQKIIEDLLRLLREKGILSNNEVPVMKMRIRSL